MSTPAYISLFIGVSARGIPAPGPRGIEQILLPVPPGNIFVKTSGFRGNLLIIRQADAIYLKLRTMRFMLCVQCVTDSYSIYYFLLARSSM